MLPATNFAVNSPFTSMPLPGVLLCRRKDKGTLIPSFLGLVWLPEVRSSSTIMLRHICGQYVTTLSDGNTPLILKWCVIFSLVLFHLNILLVSQLLVHSKIHFLFYFYYFLLLFCKCILSTFQHCNIKHVWYFEDLYKGLFHLIKRVIQACQKQHQSQYESRDP